MLIRELSLKFSNILLVFTVLIICNSVSCSKRFELYREAQEECIPNHNHPLTTEFWEAEDKELLKDIRTSFVSSRHYFHHNENCHQNYTGNEIEVGARILQYLSRRKRDRVEHMESKALSSFYLDSIHNISPQKVRQLQAEIMRKYMNTSIDPCEDFYSYACGNWGNHNPIPQDKVAYDTFEILRESLDLALKGLLEEMDLYETSPLTLEERNFLSKIKNKKRRRRRRRNFLKKRRSLKNSRAVLDPDDSILKAKNLYNSCMNYDVIKDRGVNPLLELLKEMGGWPLLEDNWDDENFDWLQLVAQLRKYNNDILIGQWVGPDIQQSEVNIIQFDQTSLGLPSRDYFLSFSSQEALKSYRKFMINVLQLMGVSFAKSEDEADRIIEFETELAKIVSAPEDRLNISLLYKKMTIGQLHDAIPQIDWTRYLEIVQERTVDENEKVIMYAYYYMKDLVLLLHSTDSATIANYLFWRFVRHRVNNLDNRFLEAKQRFYLELFGREKSPPRWKACVGQVNSNMGMAVGSMFVRKYFDENSKLDTLKMTKELQENFRKILNATEWIDVPTRKLAYEKVDAMSLKIGYPDFILSKKDLDEKYFDLKVDAGKYFENTLNVLQHLARTEQKKLGLLVNKNLWLTAPAVVNAYYSRNKNQIMFPAGILQPPFYHRHFPKALNYGGIGVVIGHELTHGFDDKGKLFDKNGNLNKWWTDSSIRSFHEKSKCLIQQYNNYTMTDGISIDGENTQGENFWTAPIVLMIVGSIIFLISFFGCCGAVKESSCMILTFSILLIIIFLTEIAIGVAGYLKHAELQGILEKQFNKTFDDFTSNIESQHAWSLIQGELECCGIKGPADWKSIFTNDTVPSSCCPTLPINVKSCTVAYASQSGCMGRLLGILDAKSLLLGGVGIGIAVIQLLGVVFACCLSRAFKEHYETV